MSGYVSLLGHLVAALARASARFAAVGNTSAAVTIEATIILGGVLFNGYGQAGDRCNWSNFDS
jgi:hypothetical protein